MKLTKIFCEKLLDILDDDPSHAIDRPYLPQKEQKKKESKVPLSFYEQKAVDFYQINEKMQVWTQNNARVRWYKEHLPHLYKRRQLLAFTRLLEKPKLSLWPDFFRWLLIDRLRGRTRRFWGIYQFVALPGEGKTMSMVAHMERVRIKMPEVYIATNFSYVHQNQYIAHWTDIVKAAMEAKKKRIPCIIAIDEIHVLFDSADWRNFPAELLALFSFNRKFSLQFLCSSQIYERIPKKVRDIANFTVICKNIWSSDRLFRNYYFTKADYESSFDGKKVSAQFVREFVASDAFYRLYDTLEQITRITETAVKEKTRQQEAFDLLFGRDENMYQKS